MAFALATPALADHNAGANLDDPSLVGQISNTQSCYYGALLSGGPDVSLGTDDYVYKRVGNSLTLVCYFSGIPSFVPGTEEGVKGDWYAPNSPKRYTEPGRCLAPGTDAASEITYLPDGTEVWQAEADARTVFYKSTMVLVCHWPDDPTR
ncbi:hypothetical protein HQQ80_06640 [Microbacteriaceae bacterium VKM Ac-2855]|nr:hypothetical protein [Microbacteriaceae bacterium VKM Ac-2855]